MLNAVSTQYLQEFTSAVIESANAVAGSKMFNITPPMETKLRQAIMESDGFLGMISLQLVSQIKGQVIDVGGDGLATGRGDGKRFLADVNQAGNTYELTKTDSGAKILWELMTQWANSGSKDEWLKMMKASISRRFALDMLRIGFNGTSIAAVTDPVANPLGQDVNKGWLTIVKEKKPAQVLAAALLDATGATADSYKNLDSLVQDLINTTIAPEHRNDPDLVVLVGHDLWRQSSIVCWSRPRCLPNTRRLSLWPKPSPAVRRIRHRSSKAIKSGSQRLRTCKSSLRKALSGAVR